MTDNNQKGSFEKIILAGIGAIATTSEKAKEILGELINKGEITVEQGKVINEELKHEVKTKIANDVVKPVNEKFGLLVMDDVSQLSDDELDELKKKIASIENDRITSTQTNLQ